MIVKKGVSESYSLNLEFGVGVTFHGKISLWLMILRGVVSVLDHVCWLYTGSDCDFSKLMRHTTGVFGWWKERIVLIDWVNSWEQCEVSDISRNIIIMLIFTILG
jgi:hypothetical protein